MQEEGRRGGRQRRSVLSSGGPALLHHHHPRPLSHCVTTPHCRQGAVLLATQPLLLAPSGSMAQGRQNELLPGEEGCGSRTMRDRRPCHMYQQHRRTRRSAVYAPPDSGSTEQSLYSCCAARTSQGALIGKLSSEEPLDPDHQRCLRRGGARLRCGGFPYAAQLLVDWCRASQLPSQSTHCAPP